MDNTTISIIIIGYNSSQGLCELLKTINSQEKINKDNIEVIYVNG